MNSGHTRMFRRVAWIGIAAALAAPATAAAGGPNGAGSSAPEDSPLRNDIAHFGISSSSRERSNATLLNDQAHYGTTQRSSTTSTSTVQPQSPAPIVVRVDGGFDWVSAGVGAAGGLGFVLVAAAAASAFRRRLHVEAAQA